MRTGLLLVLVAVPALAEDRIGTLEVGGGIGATFVRTTANPFSTYAMRATPVDVRILRSIDERLEMGGSVGVGAYYSFVARAVQADAAAQVRFLVTPPDAWAGLRLAASLGLSGQYATAGGPSCSYRLSFGSGDSTTCTHWEKETLTGPEHLAVGGVGGFEAQVVLGKFFFGLGVTGRTLPFDTLPGEHAGWLTADAGLRFGGAIPF